MDSIIAALSDIIADLVAPVTVLDNFRVDTLERQALAFQKLALTLVAAVMGVRFIRYAAGKGWRRLRADAR